MKDFMQEVQRLAESFRFELPDAQGWTRYAELVEAGNQETNLVGSKSRAELCEVLFGDAIVLMQSGWLRGALRVVDVGSGVGAPLIPLVQALPELHVTMVEARRRRVAFLRHVIGTLDLQNQISVLEQSLDAKNPHLAETPYDLALSRATWPPEQWLAIGAALANDVVVFTSGNATVSAAASLTLKGRIDYKLPAHDSSRTLWRFSAQR